MGSAPAHFGIQDSVRSVIYYVVEVHAFGAEHALVYRVIFVSLYLYFLLRVHTSQYTAADAAIRTGGFDFFIRDHKSISSIVNRFRSKIAHLQNGLSLAEELFWGLGYKLII